MNHRYRNTILLVNVPMLLLVVVGCGTAATTIAPEALVARSVITPVGVDSTVAVAADSIGRVSFVSIDQQLDAELLLDEAVDMVRGTDTLWRFLQVPTQRTTISAEDSTAAVAAALSAGTSLIELEDLLANPGLDSTDVKVRVAAMLDEAQARLEKSIRLNPFDERSRLWLVRVYEIQAERAGLEGQYVKAIDATEKLVSLKPGEHSLFAILGNNRSRLGQWLEALGNYRRAEIVYRETYDLVIDESTPPKADSTILYQYIRAQGDVLVQLRDAKNASSRYMEAQKYARTSETRNYLQEELAWIAWDEGNIAASFARDSLLTLERVGEADKAASGYRDLLLGLRSQRAKNEIDWRLAIVEFNAGNTESSVERLQRLANRLTLGDDGVPVDSVEARYLDDYGGVCLRIGREYLNKHRDNRSALAYFMQASRVNWHGRPIANFEIAALLRSNTDQSLKAAELSLDEEERLSTDERKALYQLLMTLYRSKADFEKARIFRDRYRGLL